VVVHDLDVQGVSLLPTKADPPLLVHSDAVLTATLSREALQSIPGGRAQILQRLCGVDHEELAQGVARYGVSEPTCALPPEHFLRVLVAEGANHVEMITSRGITVKRYGGAARLQSEVMARRPAARQPGGEARCALHLIDTGF
jgi:hypothetical protein